MFKDVIICMLLDENSVVIEYIAHDALVIMHLWLTASIDVVRLLEGLSDINNLLACNNFEMHCH